ncbi:MAG: cation transporter [Planctomycetaceae bacterium]
MKAMSLSGLSLLLMASTANAQAVKVEIKGTHLCCGACVKAVGATLEKVQGIAGLKCDRKAKTISFEAMADEIAKQAVRKIANAGFYGKLTIGGKKAKFPPSGAKKDQKADTIVIRKVHLCCGACVKAVGGAVKSVKGVESVVCNRKKNTVTVKGKQFDVSATIAALNKVGFNGRVRRKKKTD